MYPRAANASPPSELNKLPRIPAPTITSTPTTAKKVSARPHIFCSAWPSPGTNQPAMAKAIARASRFVSWRGAAAVCVSSVIVSLPLRTNHLREERQDLLLHRTGHARFALTDVNIHFAADPKLPQVDPRLNRRARARNQMTNIMRFEPIHVDAVAVHALADAVACAVEKIFTVASSFDHAPRGIIHLPALQRLAFCNRGLD